MVTTTTHQEITALFQEAVRKAGEVIATTDALEEEVRDLSCKVVVAAMRVVLPGLKLVDKDHKINVLVSISKQVQSTADWNWVRGVALSNPRGEKYRPLILSRDGEVYVPYGLSEDTPYGPAIKLDEFNLKKMGWGVTSGPPESSEAEAALHFLEQLKVIFAEAMQKNEARHTKMGELRDKVGTAVAALSPEKLKA